METMIENLVSIYSEHHKAKNVKEIEHAFLVACQAHAGQLRRSGEEYITHPVAVAEILADIGMDEETIVAALLHDTVEDTNYSLDSLRREFGNNIAGLVDGVTKLDRLNYGETAQAETLRKMVIAMSKDIRVLVIKLADRLHNARTWSHVAPESAMRKARETLDIYAPLAHRLGISTMKWELEDISFRTLEPKIYSEIERLVIERNPAREALTQDVIEIVKTELAHEKITGKVVGRPKHLYSIYQKMVVRGREFSEIYDLIGVRIIVDNVRDCYGALGAIHAQWSPVPGRFKDYIAMPKFNLYQSLHTTVIGPNGKAVEIQIRTTEMNVRAEYGIAAHWKYKNRKGASDTNQPSMQWLKQIHDLQQDTQDVGEFLDALRYDLNTPEVFVFTPKGSVIALPLNSTPVDFAYAVHTEVGNKCVGAKVNGKLVPLDSKLSNGDSVEVLINKHFNAAPSRDWLAFVSSTRARSKIKTWFSKERKEEAIVAGQESIARQMRKVGLPLQQIMAGETLIQIAHDLHYPDIESMYAAVGNGHISAQMVVEKIIALSSFEEDSHSEELSQVFPHVSPISNRNNSGVEVDGQADLYVKLARCCTPVPGDEIIGFITKGSGVSVHRKLCVNLIDLRKREANRLIDVSWNLGVKSIFLVNIQVEALDRARLLADLTKVLSDQHVNILTASVGLSKDRSTTSRFTFEMADATHLDAVFAAIRHVEGVYDVYRINNN